MAATSLVAAVADLVSLLATTAITGVTKVYGYEPGGDANIDRAVTVSATSMSPDFFEFAVRIYVRVTDTSQAQDRLYALVDAVDTRLRSTAEFGPSDWTFTFEPDMGALVATNQVTCGRQDYY